MKRYEVRQCAIWKPSCARQVLAGDSGVHRKPCCLGKQGLIETALTPQSLQICGKLLQDTASAATDGLERRHSWKGPFSLAELAPDGNGKGLQ